LYLAPADAISLPEIVLLLEVILEETPSMARMAVSWIDTNDAEPMQRGSC